MTLNQSQINKSIPILALIILATMAIFFYGGICQAGFTLDEFSHLTYPYQTFNGHPEAFLGKLFGSWTSGKEDGIMAYRPTTCTTFVIDYAIWQTRVVGWHISNLIFYIAVCFSTGAVTTSLLRRALTEREALWGGAVAGALMFLYPGHPDSVATLVGRVDSLPTAFYLLAFYLYIEFRKDQKRGFLFGSLTSFWLALGAKETAITLPLILFAAEMLSLVGPSDNSKIEWKKKFLDSLRNVAPFVATLAVFAVLRTIVLHGHVGGYGKFHLKTMFKQFLNFADLATIQKILIPINEHYPMAQAVTQAMYLSYGLALLNIITAMRNTRLAKVVVFFAFWTVLNVLLTFQIWHIYPNLVGFRLFFLSSSAFCGLLATGFLLDKHKGMSALNIAAAIFLCTVWGCVLNNNLQPFEAAAKMMHTLEMQAHDLSKSVDGTSEKILLLNLPQDFCGAPMLGKPAFLAVMMQPPLATEDLRSHILVSEERQIRLLTDNFKLLKLDQLDQPFDASANAIKVRAYSWDEKLGHFTAVPPVRN